MHKTKLQPDTRRPPGLSLETTDPHEAPSFSINNCLQTTAVKLQTRFPLSGKDLKDLQL